MDMKSEVGNCENLQIECPQEVEHSSVGCWGTPRHQRRQEETACEGQSAAKAKFLGEWLCRTLAQVGSAYFFKEQFPYVLKDDVNFLWFWVFYVDT